MKIVVGGMSWIDDDVHKLILQVHTGTIFAKFYPIPQPRRKHPKIRSTKLSRQHKTMELLPSTLYHICSY